MKKLLFISAILFIFSSIAFSQSVQSGTWFVGSGEGFTLDKGTGERIMTIEVEFPKPFEKKPMVFVGVNYVDADKTTNLRYKVEATSVSRDGFTLKISTWGDTKIFGLGGFWVAHQQ